VSLLDRIRECNRRDMRHFRPFIVAGERVGWVKLPFLDVLRDFPRVFAISDTAVVLNPVLADAGSRTKAVDEVLRRLAEQQFIQGWRDEPYPVTLAWGRTPLMLMERAAVPAFGIRAYGVHMNGFVREGGELRMWVGRRARDKPTFPGMLDNLVAGGQPAGISLMDNLVKECGEEADIAEPLARRAVLTGALTYSAEVPEGLKPDMQFVYELELPRDFTPRNTDGEIEEFFLWPIEEVARIVAETNEFKFNCNLVIIHFLLRHGLLPPGEPDFAAILRGLSQ
jgi:isopentenyldiphosphate isomerase